MQLLHLSVTGKKFTFQVAQSPLYLGRSEECEIALPDTEGVSQQHARCVFDQGFWSIEDNTSTNGVYVNQIRISAPVVLKNGDSIKLGPESPEIICGTKVAEGTKVLNAPTSLLDRADKKGVGAQTLQVAIEQAASRERSRTFSVLIVVVLVLLAGIAFLATQLKEQKEESQQKIAELEQQQADTESILEEQRRSEEENAAKLMAELLTQRDNLEKIGAEQSVSTQALREASEQEIEKLRAQLKEITDEQSAQAKAGWSNIVDKYEESVFLCLAIKGDSVGIGTAFAISESGVLATNAHVVKMLLEADSRRVIQNKTGVLLEIKDMLAHPRFKGSHSPDVGLIRLVSQKDQRFTALPMADQNDLEEIRIGQQLGTLGFPGELTDQYLSLVGRGDRRFKSVLATFKTGWIGRLTDFSGRVVPVDQATLIQHSASLTGGTSGSPMLNEQGQVFAISNATLGKVTKSGHDASAAEIAFAINISQLDILIDASEWLEK